MTSMSVMKALQASNQNLSRLAFRTAYYTRIQPKHLPKSEDAIFKTGKAAKPRQSMKQQLAMAKLITQALH